MPRDHPVRPRLALPSGFVLALALPLLAAAAAAAATLPVTTTADADVDDAFCSLREAIVAANTDGAYHGCPAGAGADRIVFSLSLPAAISLASDLPTITSTLAIRGPDATQLAIDGQDLHRLLVVDSASGGEWLGVEDLTLTRGLAPVQGGGAFVAPGDTGYFRRVRFFSNQATNNGGGLAVAGLSALPSAVGVEACWFSDNLAHGPSGGGGLTATGFTTLWIDRTTFSGNRADGVTGSGGALVVNRADATVTRSTFSDNYADVGGGAIFLFSSTAEASLLLQDSTVTDNHADADANGSGDGGGIFVVSAADHAASLTLVNTIVAFNTDELPQVHYDLSFGAFVVADSLGSNLIGLNLGSETFFPAGLPNGNGDWVGQVGTPINPELDPLGDNGGFGPDHEPVDSMTSRVIDHGACPGSGGDQRGYGDASAHLRIVDLPAANGAGSDGCDIGAHERGGAPEADPD
ncbi:MAG: CSLREA domain-containing protein, partial [Solirubrobacterales bacterium]|nr:CSLREA domain-containing protein [Solirubrobacterales bacterium]